MSLVLKASWKSDAQVLIFLQLNEIMLISFCSLPARVFAISYCFSVGSDLKNAGSGK